MEAVLNNRVKLSKICGLFNLQYIGKDIEIDGLGLCNRASENRSILSYVTNEKYINHVKNNSSISCILVSESLADIYSAGNLGRRITYIFSDNPEKVFYEIHEELCKSGDLYEKYDFPSKTGENCAISEYAVIEKGVLIGNRVTIGHNTVVKSGTIIEDDTVIGCNSTIGSEGFQLITNGDNPPSHITHVGKCHIGSNVYIGDNTCVCNSLFEGETYIGDGAKIDNLVYVAHNVYIGSNAVITAHVILCGSCRVEKGAWIAPNASIINRVTIGEYSKVGMGSVVTKDVEPYTVVFGSPAKEHTKK